VTPAFIEEWLGSEVLRGELLCFLMRRLAGTPGAVIVKEDNPRKVPVASRASAARRTLARRADDKIAM
jgi:hypothetical protein